MKYMLIAGEASGDLHAASLIAALRDLDPEARFAFFGGDLMEKAAGKKPVLHYSKMNVMGFSEVVRNLPTIIDNYRLAVALLEKFRPDLLILVDYPSFNLRLAKKAHTLGIRADWYISPKVWAWKEWRVRSMRKYISRLYCILPFEIPFFKAHDFRRAFYVGNPSVEEIDDRLRHLPPERYFRERQGLTDPRPIIALLPGSRFSEIRANLPLMIEAAKRYKEFQYVVAAAPSVPEKLYREIAQDPGLPMVFGAAIPLLKYAVAALVTSGTATLETALVGTPQVVCYRGNGSALTYDLMSRLLKVRYVSLPNLIMDNSIVPELLLNRCTPDSISRELSPLLQPSPRRDWQVQGYRNMRRRLGTNNAASTAASLIFRSLQSPQPSSPEATPPQ